MTTILAIIGWLFILSIGAYYTIFTVFVIFNCLGDYTIGGVPNTWSDKLWAFVVIAFGVLVWWGVFHSAPFTVNLTF